jgi:phenylacetate-CoA ligase
VANEFGSRDIGLTAHETPQGQMLLLSESILLEVLDGEANPVPTGDIGEAVVTGLCSEAQPFIRYRTGDMVRVSEETCRSGRGLHVIAEVTGRSTDFLVRADGTVMHALAAIYVLRELEGVSAFRLVQYAPDCVQVEIVANSRWSEQSYSQLTAGLRARLGGELRVKVLLVDEIAPEASGKYRYVVSHVPLPGGLGTGQSGSESLMLGLHATR